MNLSSLIALEMQLVLAGVGSAILLGSFFTRRQVRFWRIAFLVLSLVSILLVFTGPYAEKSSAPTGSAVALVDVSISMDETEVEPLLSRLRSIAPDVSLIAFAGLTASFAVVDDEYASYHQMREAFSSLDSGKTNIAAALQTIADRSESQVFLISDGFHSEGALFDSLPPSANTSGSSPAFRLYPLLPDSPSTEMGEVDISQVSHPLRSLKSSSVPIKVVLSNPTTSVQSGQLTVTQAGRRLSYVEVDLASNNEKIFEIPSHPDAEGI